MSTRTAPEQTYRDLVQKIAESLPLGATSVRDLPELTLEDLGTVLKHYPAAFAESVCEVDPDLAGLCADRLSDTRTKKPLDRYSQIGLCVVGYIRAYVRSLVLRDVQLEIERMRRLDALEGLSARSEERAAVRQARRLS